MPHIETPAIPGIRGLIAARPSMGEPLLLLAHTLLRGPSPLSVPFRELIATTVSAENGCQFCTRSHAAAANACANNAGYVDSPNCSPLESALLDVARAVQKSGKHVDASLLQAARDAGADDDALHDTVLIAAAFCMYNRYVDGLGALTPDDPAAYAQMGQRLAAQGYQPLQPAP